MCSRVVSPLCADATRLWCVMELFVYLRMGGQRESIVIKLLDDGDDLPRKLARFDTGKGARRGALSTTTARNFSP